MSRFRLPITLALALAVAPAVAHAQATTYGLGVNTSALLSAGALGAGDVLLYGGRITVAPHGWARIGFGLDYSPEGEVASIRRGYNLLAPTVDLEGTLTGRDTKLYGVLSPTYLMFNLEERGAAPKERVSIPAVGVGLGVAAKIMGPFSVDVRAQDMLTWTRPNILRNSLDMPRELAHSPRVEARVTINFRKRERIARFEDLPVSFSNDLAPVRAAIHQDPVLKETIGREHTHPANGVERETEAPYQHREAAEDQLLGTVYFKSGSFAVGSDYQSVVRDVAEYLRANPGTNVVVRGFTSPAGNARYNLHLAERRANAVRDQLVGYYQIKLQRVDAVTGGVDPENGADAARRVEIRTVKLNKR